MGLLQVNQLHFSYPKKTVLRGVDLQLEPGGIFCVFGTNGCGKTTLLDCILGLHPQAQGTVMLDGQDTTLLSSRQKARKMAYVSQKSNRTFPYSVLEMVLMGRTAHAGVFSSPGREDLRIAEAALDRLGMHSFRDRIYTRLSGGEAQMVKIARAMAQGADLILFDEPTTHLDFRHELNVLKYMMEIVKKHGINIVMATHAPNHAFLFESQGIPVKVALMDHGVFGAVGPPSEVLTPDNMEKVFGVVTRRFSNFDGDQMHHVVLPVDFCGDGVRQRE